MFDMASGAGFSRLTAQNHQLQFIKSDILHILRHLLQNRTHSKSDPMAIKATIFKADLQIADMDRHYYQNHSLTIARHPSETDERMMVRLLAFVRHAGEALSFGKGLSDVDEPDLWQKDLTGAIDLWIEVGQPDEKRILKACGRAAHVVIYSYSSNSSIWWNQIGSRIERARNLTVINLPSTVSLAMAKLAQRNMQLQCTVQDGQIWLTGNGETVQVDLTMMKMPALSAG
ncbi:MAG: hypothetical protein JWQ21_3145 [Herminiimonas sp.]|nr:hypothetical protein [Herminiimonas sp.]